MIDVIKNRSSYRGAYKDIPVPRQDLITIMEAGLVAPSGCNKQTTSLVGVDDPELLRELKAGLKPPIGATAPAFIVVLSQKIYAHGHKSYFVQDYSACIENMLLAIEALGYKSCWYEGDITTRPQNARHIGQVLNVPEGYKVVCLVPVGIAVEESTHPNKKSFEERAWFNRFATNLPGVE